jgi:Raf kinase inhibitor-like YbhB/YbcL family protein
MVFVLGVVLCSCQKNEPARPEGDVPMKLSVTSPAFEHGGKIPPQYTADGADISPPLQWQGVPSEARSLALICDDPDAPMGTWVHWLVWNIPPDSTGLPEGVPAEMTLEDGARQGKTDFGRVGYGGPAPPSGTHRYYFKVYALDTMLNLPAGATKPQLEKAMQGHIIAQGELMGTYSRSR